MAERITLVGLTQVSVGVHLDDAEVRPPSRMSPDGAQRAGVFPGEGHQEPTAFDVRTDKVLNRLDRLLINLPTQLQRGSRRHAVPVPVRFGSQRLVIELDLV